jgi:hypothetical protein
VTALKGTMLREKSIGLLDNYKNIVGQTGCLYR